MAASACRRYLTLSLYISTYLRKFCHSLDLWLPSVAMRACSLMICSSAMVLKSPRPIAFRPRFPFECYRATLYRPSSVESTFTASTCSTKDLIRSCGSNLCDCNLSVASISATGNLMNSRSVGAVRSIYLSSMTSSCAFSAQPSTVRQMSSLRIISAVRVDRYSR